MSEARIIVIYHANCLDGFAAAFAAWLRFKEYAEYIPANYCDAPPEVTGAEVYIVDFSYPREVLLRMHEQATSLLVLDHHKTAQEALEGLEFAQFDMSQAGCLLAYRHFHPTSPTPQLFTLVQDRDLWKFDYTETKAFNTALFSLVPRTFSAWEACLNDAKVTELVLRGEDLLNVFAGDIEALLKHKCEVSVNGRKGLAVNAPPKYASELGNRLAQESGTFGLTYTYAGDRGAWDFSIRSIGDYDVSIIAKEYGGGGHKNAAGFSAESLHAAIGVLK